MPLKLVMMGTGTFALPAFRALLDSPHDVRGLVTQPDRTGRGHHQHRNPLKELALERGLTVLQPEKVNTPESLDELRSLDADLFVVAAYGQILKPDLLEIPRLGAVNLHASLLPKYRGAAPVQYAVWNGETRTGVTIFQIEPKLDTGPMLGVVETEIGPKETSGELHDRLAELAAPLTLCVVDELEQGTVPRRPQPPGDFAKAPRFRKEQGEIDWSKSAEQIGWHVRAMQPWPGPYTFVRVSDQSPQRVLILDVEPASADDSGGVLAAGEIRVQDKRLFVGTGTEPVEVLRIQPAGKRAMAAEEYLRGRSLTGATFGNG